MTVQQINLYPVAASSRVPFPDARALLVSLTAIVCALAVVSAVGIWRVRLAAQEVARLTAENAALTTRVGGGSAAATPSQGALALQQEVARLQTLRARQEEIRVELSLAMDRDQRGFSPLFDGLAQGALQGVWLNDIQLGQSGTRLGGHLVAPDRLPAYLKRLGDVPSYRGSTFALVQLEREQDGSGYRFTLDQKRGQP